MVKNSKVSVWQRNADHVIERYVDIRTGEVDDVFNEHVDYLRQCKDDFDTVGYPAHLYPSLLTQFMMKFKLPLEMKAVVRNYIETDEIDLSLMRPPIAAIDERDKSYKLNIDEVDEEQYWEEYADQKSFKLIIPDGTTTSEIIEFIRNEKSFIDEKLGNLGVPPKRGKISPPWLAIRIVNLNRLGISNDEISKRARIEEWPCNPLGPNEVAVILKRAKDKRK